jgi:DNA end-binding protein Ku
MRSIWSGIIGFGLVNIPVKVFSAIKESSLDLDMLDKKDLSNIKFKRVNENTGKEVSWDNIVRAFNLNGKYVVLTDKDFEQAMPEKTKVIEIFAFVNEDQLDPMLYETPFYLEPEKQGLRAYSLLNTALIKSKKVGLGSFVLRNRESLCLIRANKGLLVLHRLRFSQEIRSTDEINISKTAPKPAELKMAITLIEQLSKPLKIDLYKDTYSAKLMKLIKAKASGNRYSPVHLKVVHSKARDLMGQLKASLETKKRKTS